MLLIVHNMTATSIFFRHVVALYFCAWHVLSFILLYKFILLSSLLCSLMVLLFAE